METFLIALAALLAISLALLIVICAYNICLGFDIRSESSESKGPYFRIEDIDDYPQVHTKLGRIQPKGQTDPRRLLNEELNESRNQKGQHTELEQLCIADAKAVERTPRPDSTLPPDSLGRLSFSLRYDTERQVLLVHLIGGRNISLKGGELASWTIVNVRISDFGSSEQESDPDESSNPEYDQEFIFFLPSNKVGASSVLFSVWDINVEVQRTHIGYVKISLGNFIETLITKNGTGPLSREIRDTEVEDIPKRKNGEILFSLSYNMVLDCLSVAVLKCKGISTLLEDTGVYVKVTLLAERWPLMNKRTSTRQKHSDPLFKQILNFENCIAANGYDIRDLGLAVSLRARTLTSQKRVLGRAFLGNAEFSSAEGRSHWGEMVKTPNSAVAQWHALEY